MEEQVVRHFIADEVDDRWHSYMWESLTWMNKKNTIILGLSMLCAAGVAFCLYQSLKREFSKDTWPSEADPHSDTGPGPCPAAGPDAGPGPGKGPAPAPMPILTPLKDKLQTFVSEETNKNEGPTIAEVE